jgi:hypothetical protein
MASEEVLGEEVLVLSICIISKIFKHLPEIWFTRVQSYMEMIRHRQKVFIFLDLNLLFDIASY